MSTSSPAHELTTTPGPLSFHLAGLTEGGDGGVQLIAAVCLWLSAPPPSSCRVLNPTLDQGSIPETCRHCNQQSRARRKRNPNVCASADSACCLLHLLSAATILPTCGGVGLGVRIGPGCG